MPEKPNLLKSMIKHGYFPLNHKMSVFYICSVKKGQSHSIMHDANEV